MPQLRKLTALSGSILPKIEFHSKNTYNSYPVDQHLLAPSYLSMLVDRDRALITTSEPESDGSESTQTGPRKRQRLDHLSQEEKLLRRKMKNRVAAQTARDRKKARMAELEEQVSELQTEKKVLLLTNIELRNKNALLEKENAELKLRLGIQSVDETLKEAKKEKEEASDCEHSRVSDCKSLEYAEGTGHADSYSLDDAIRLLTNCSETDALLDLLQQCSEDLMQYEDASSSNLCQNGEDRKNISDPKVVGASSKSLESHKELIHFDHIYYKQKEADACPDVSALSLPESELSTKEINLDQSQISESDCVEITDSTDIPTIHITSESESFNPVLHFESEVFPVDDFNSQLLYPADTTRCVSPTSSDAGYDSSFSASSPSSAGTSWDETLTELFPSLV